MADGTKEPVGFRISTQERSLLELIAAARGVTLSSLARNFVMDMAHGVVKEAGGIDSLIEQAQRRRREEELTRQKAREEQARAAVEAAHLQ